jgi:hypothetical protein
MATQFKHKRYFRVLEDFNREKAGQGYLTFSSVADAKTKIGFKSCWDTSTPTKTEALEDSGRTFVVTYEFNSDSDQSAFKTAVDAEYSGSATPFTPGSVSAYTRDVLVENFKTEWFAGDGSTVDHTYTID